MKEAKLITEEKHYVKCRNCDHQFGVGHLMDRETDIKWFCEDCGHGIVLIFKDKKVYIDESFNEKKQKIMYILRYHDIVVGVFGTHGKEGINFSGSQYHFEEGTCSINILTRAEIVFDLQTQDADPHGLFKLMGIVDIEYGQEPEDLFTNKHLNVAVHKALES